MHPPPLSTIHVPAALPASHSQGEAAEIVDKDNEQQPQESGLLSRIKHALYRREQRPGWLSSPQPKEAGTTRKKGIGELPPEVMVNVYKHVSAKDLHSSLLVSRGFHQFLVSSGLFLLRSSQPGYKEAQERWQRVFPALKDKTERYSAEEEQALNELWTHENAKFIEEHQKLEWLTCLEERMRAWTPQPSDNTYNAARLFRASGGGLFLRPKSLNEAGRKRVSTLLLLKCVGPESLLSFMEHTRKEQFLALSEEDHANIIQRVHQHLIKKYENSTTSALRASQSQGFSVSRRQINTHAYKQKLYLAVSKIQQHLPMFSQNQLNKIFDILKGEDELWELKILAPVFDRLSDGRQRTFLHIGYTKRFGMQYLCETVMFQSQEQQISTLTALECDHNEPYRERFKPTFMQAAGDRPSIYNQLPPSIQGRLDKIFSPHYSKIGYIGIKGSIEE